MQSLTSHDQRIQADMFQIQRCEARFNQQVLRGWFGLWVMVRKRPLPIPSKGLMSNSLKPGSHEYHFLGASAATGPCTTDHQGSRWFRVPDKQSAPEKGAERRKPEIDEIMMFTCWKRQGRKKSTLRNVARTLTGNKKGSKKHSANTFSWYISCLC